LDIKQKESKKKAKRKQKESKKWTDLFVAVHPPNYFFSTTIENC